MQFLSFGLVSSVAIAIVLIVVLTKAVKFVPQNRAFVVNDLVSTPAPWKRDLIFSTPSLIESLITEP